MRFRIASAFALISILLVPLASADILDEAMKDFPVPGFARDLFQGNDNDGYSATVGDITAFVYLDKGVPIVAVTWKQSLGIDKLIPEIGSVFEANLENPTLFWMRDGGTLHHSAMPETLRGSVKAIGMPDEQEVTARYNLFGKFSSSTALAPAHLNGLYVGFSKRDMGYAARLSVPAGVEWDGPFHLAKTKVKAATVEIVSDGTDKTVEAWGTATIDNQGGFTIYALQKKGVLETLAFDTKEASLRDYFAILGVVAGTAGKVVALPSPPLPPDSVLKVVTLKNPREPQTYQPGVRPDFGQMMFRVTAPQGQVAALDVNCKGTVAGVDVAEVQLHASQDEVTLKVPAKCALQPVELQANLGNVTSGNLNVKAELKDCFSAELRKIVDGTVDIANDVSAATGNAANAAKNLADKATSDAAASAGVRAQAWQSAVTTNASLAADDACAAASKSWTTINTEFGNAVTAVDDLTKKIAKFLDQALKWATGGINELITERDAKTAYRNQVWTQLAAATDKLAAAKAVRDQKRGEPGANFDPAVADSEHDFLAKDTAAKIHKNVESYAKNLNVADVLPGARANYEGFVAGQTAYFARTDLDLADTIKARDDLLNTARKSLLADSVSQLIEAKMTSALAEEVPQIATVPFDIPVRITTDGLCMKLTDSGNVWIKSPVMGVLPCANSDDEVFVLRANGNVEYNGQCVVADSLSGVMRAGSCDQAHKYFFDPSESIFRTAHPHEMTINGRVVRSMATLCLSDLDGKKLVVTQQCGRLKWTLQAAYPSMRVPGQGTAESSDDLPHLKLPPLPTAGTR